MHLLLSSRVALVLAPLQLQSQIKLAANFAHSACVHSRHSWSKIPLCAPLFSRSVIPAHRTFGFQAGIFA